jgi:general secretion pathway protein D
MCVFVYTSWGHVEAVPPSGQKVEVRPASQFQVIPAEGKPEQRLVKINFDDVDIVLFIKFISEITGRNFLIDPKVKGKVTIVSATELTVEEAYNVFQSVLEVHGFTIVPAGSIIKIVPSAEGRRKNVETQPAR